MTLKHEYDGTILTNRIQLSAEKGFSAHALLGQADSIHVLVDDPSMNLTIRGRKRWRMIEDACPTGNQVVWRGRVGEKVISRGSGTTFPFGRRWDVELIEDNTLATLRALTIATANRPAETDGARIAWLLTTPGFSGVIFDRGLVEASGVMLDAEDYRPARTGADVLRDCSAASGYNFFLRYHEATDTVELAYYDTDVSLLDTSSLRISNAGDDDLVTTWPAGYDAKLGQSPARVAAGIVLPYRGGYVYRTSAATADAFGTGDLVMPSAAVKSAATATTLADRLLIQHGEEDERLTGLRIQLPAAHLNDVKPGHRINVRLTHLPRFAAYRPCRVTSKVFSRPDNDSQAVYDVDLDLSPGPYDPIVQSMSWSTGAAGGASTFAAPVTAGNLLVIAIGRRTGGAAAMPAALGIKVNNQNGRSINPTTFGAPTYAEAGGGVAGNLAAAIAYATVLGDEQTIYLGATDSWITVYELSGVAAANAEVKALSFQPASAAKSLGAWSVPGAFQIARFIIDTNDGQSSVAAAGTGWSIDDQGRSTYYGGVWAPHTPCLHSLVGTPAVVSNTSLSWGAIGVALRAS